MDVEDAQPLSDDAREDTDETVPPDDVIQVDETLAPDGIEEEINDFITMPSPSPPPSWVNNMFGGDDNFSDDDLEFNFDMDNRDDMRNSAQTNAVTCIQETEVDPMDQEYQKGQSETKESLPQKFEEESIPEKLTHQQETTQDLTDTLKSHYDVMVRICNIVQDLPTSKLMALAGPVFNDLQKLIDARKEMFLVHSKLKQTSGEQLVQEIIAASCSDHFQPNGYIPRAQSTPGNLVMCSNNHRVTNGNTYSSDQNVPLQTVPHAQSTPIHQTSNCDKNSRMKKGFP
ncbi:uncharacterized protein LOC135483954 [Lineus longissimus]|uniref:uncharacterized protein LOC135483954 n=1 Tax=Lineus longissimus TaxID=88925 RepID=UPI00315D68A6